MADNDIYNSKPKYEYIRDHLDDYAKPPRPGFEGKGRNRRFWIKNPANVQYIRKFLGTATWKGLFDARDTSYIRRLRLFRTMLMAGHFIQKDFKDAEREDVDQIVGFANDHNRSPKTKRDFIIDLKFIWKQLFPERDEKGRIDETLIPYAVRHLSSKIDKSKERMRGDKFSLQEFERLLKAFGDDPRMQCLLTVALESLARPQELLGRRIRNVELFDNYAKIYITEHGKEGIGFLRVIDSYPYLARWLGVHPLRDDPDAFLFINTGRMNQYQQLKPFAAAKLLRTRASTIGIHKPLTLYSLKRNGITLMRLAGRSDLDIQHTARWTSTKQLKTYDLSNQEESFKIELIKRGRIKADKAHEEFTPTSKTCTFCGTENGMADTFCTTCKRPLNREAIELEAKEQEEKFRLINEQLANLMNKQEQMENKIETMPAAMTR
ncbi:MAG: tyrosine-type recombinase/integrase [Nanoarchaeota archaeon]